MHSDGGRAATPRSWRLRLPSSAAAVLCVLGSLFVAVSSPTTAAASVGSDQTRIAQLEQLINQEGLLVQSLVERYDQAQGHLTAVQGMIAGDRGHLAADHRSEDAATVHLRSIAVDAYVNAWSTASFLGSANATTAPEQQVYLNVASGSLNEAVAALETDQHTTSAEEVALRSEESELTASLAQLATARQRAQTAISTDEATLSHVKSNLLAQVIAANERREAAAEQAAEVRQAQQQAALRAEQQAKAAAAPKPVRTTHPTPSPTTPPSPPPTTTPPTTTPPTTTPPSTGAGYANPLRAISGLSPERIDQGVDYSGYGPIYAVGDGVVLATVNGGWPGGTFIAYRLTDGPASGLVVYAAEDISPDVSVGQTVSSSTVLGQMYEGPDGIETGWADGSALGETMAASSGQFSGANSTAFGYNFSQLLEVLGAPPGILQNNLPTGSLPAGWPSW